MVEKWLILDKYNSGTKIFEHKTLTSIKFYTVDMQAA